MQKFGYHLLTLSSSPLPQSFIHGNRCRHRSIKRIYRSQLGNGYQKITIFFHQWSKPLLLAAKNYGNGPGQITIIDGLFGIFVQTNDPGTGIFAMLNGLHQIGSPDWLPGTNGCARVRRRKLWKPQASEVHCGLWEG